MATTLPPTTTALGTRDDPTGDGGAAASRKGGRKIIVAAVATVAVVGAAYFLVLAPMLFPPQFKPGQPVPNGQIVSLPSDTINLTDGHLLQVTVALQLTAPARTATISADTPKFLNGELTIFGALTYPDLLNPVGRDAAQLALLHLFQHIAGTSEGAQQISAVYFTSFIAQ